MLASRILASLRRSVEQGRSLRERLPLVAWLFAVGVGVISVEQTIYRLFGFELVSVSSIDTLAADNKSLSVRSERLQTDLTIANEKLQSSLSERGRGT